MKRTGSGSGPRQDGCTCGELVPEHLPDCPVVPFAAALPSPETTPAPDDELRAALDKTISVIDDPSKYTYVNPDYRAGWLDALKALRDDPALAALPQPGEPE